MAMKIIFAFKLNGPKNRQNKRFYGDCLRFNFLAKRQSSSVFFFFLSFFTEIVFRFAGKRSTVLKWPLAAYLRRGRGFFYLFCLFVFGSLVACM